MGIFKDLEKAAQFVREVKNAVEYGPGSNLPVDFVMSVEDEMKSWESAMVEMSHYSRNTQSDEERIANLKRLIAYFEKFQEYCYSKGGNYISYFQERWEHCRNSANPDFCYIDPYKDELEYIETIKIPFRKSFTAFLKEYGPLKQSEAFKIFDMVRKNDIQDTIRQLVDEGVISKEKAGNTYLLAVLSTEEKKPKKVRVVVKR